RAISILGNLALRFNCLPRFSSGALDIRVHETAFGEEFTSLDSRTVGMYSIRGFRTAEFLNWRYLKNPLSRYCVVSANRESTLVGYGVVEVNETDWILTDLRAIEETKIVSGILAYIAQMLRMAGADRISAAVMEGSSLASLLRRAGFHARERRPVVAYMGK